MASDNNDLVMKEIADLKSELNEIKNLLRKDRE